MTSNVLPHRAFATVELPFTVEVTQVTTTSTSSTQTVSLGIPPSQKRKVESFLPSDVMYDFFEGGASSAAPSGNLAEGDQASEKQVGFFAPDSYKTEPVWSTWRGTDWESDSEEAEPHVDGLSHPSSAAMGGMSHKELEAMRKDNETLSRRSLFPSIIPQLLVQGFYRNDAVVRVRRKYRVRRFRSRQTGEIIREEEISESEENASEATKNSPTITTEVLGIVSRELQLTRPADFSFSLSTPEEASKSPGVIRRDFFPPLHFLTEKGVFELRYHPGKYVNPAVLATAAATSTHPAEAREFEASFLVPDELMLRVMPEDVLPPPQLESQKKYLERFSSSPTGMMSTDPEDVRTIAALLRTRPVWIIADLLEAAERTGVCPRPFFNKRVINALTYLIPVGPFNRCRIRLDFNPYRSPFTMFYQRISGHLNRRSTLGLLLKDIARSSKVEAALHMLRTDSSNPVPAPWQLPSAATLEELPFHDDQSMPNLMATPRCGLREYFCRMIRKGNLVYPFQLVDVIEAEPFQRTVAAVMAKREGTGEMPETLRSEPFGWMDEKMYSSCLTNFASLLHLFVEDEIIPLLNHLSDPSEQRSARPVTEKANSEINADDEEDEEDEESAEESMEGHSRSSSMSSSSISSRRSEIVQDDDLDG